MLIPDTTSFDEKFRKYSCEKCGHLIITEVVDDGETPIMIRCDKCKNGDAYTYFFDCPQNLEAKYEWFKPKDNDEIKKQIAWELKTFYDKDQESELAEIKTLLFKNTKRHVEEGGLLLRAKRV